MMWSACNLSILIKIIIVMKIIIVIIKIIIVIVTIITMMTAQAERTVAVRDVLMPPS